MTTSAGYLLLAETKTLIDFVLSCIATQYVYCTNITYERHLSISIDMDIVDSSKKLPVALTIVVAALNDDRRWHRQLLWQFLKSSSGSPGSSKFPVGPKRQPKGSQKVPSSIRKALMGAFWCSKGAQDSSGTG